MTLVSKSQMGIFLTVCMYIKHVTIMAKTFITGIRDFVTVFMRFKASCYMAQKCMANEGKLLVNVQCACNHVHTVNQYTSSESFDGFISHPPICYISWLISSMLYIRLLPKHQILPIRQKEGTEENLTVSQ